MDKKHDKSLCFDKDLKISLHSPFLMGKDDQIRREQVSLSHIRLLGASGKNSSISPVIVGYDGTDTIITIPTFDYSDVVSAVLCGKQAYFRDFEKQNIEKYISYLRGMIKPPNIWRPSKRNIIFPSGMIYYESPQKKRYEDHVGVFAGLEVKVACLCDEDIHLEVLQIPGSDLRKEAKKLRSILYRLIMDKKSEEQKKSSGRRPHIPVEDRARTAGEIPGWSGHYC